MPATYIYEPWKAPKQVQERARCIVGRDYPLPIVDHGIASKACMDKMAAAYKLHKEDKEAAAAGNGARCGEARGSTLRQQANATSSLALQQFVLS
jgi:cryptochrome